MNEMNFDFSKNVVKNYAHKGMQLVYRNMVQDLQLLKQLQCKLITLGVGDERQQICTFSTDYSNNVRSYDSMSNISTDKDTGDQLKTASIRTKHNPGGSFTLLEEYQFLSEGDFCHRTARGLADTMTSHIKSNLFDFYKKSCKVIGSTSSLDFVKTLPTTLRSKFHKDGYRNVTERTFIYCDSIGDNLSSFNFSSGFSNYPNSDQLNLSACYPFLFSHSASDLPIHETPVALVGHKLGAAVGSDGSDTITVTFVGTNNRPIVGDLFTLGSDKQNYYVVDSVKNNTLTVYPTIKNASMNTPLNFLGSHKVSLGLSDDSIGFVGLKKYPDDFSMFRNNNGFSVGFADRHLCLPLYMRQFDNAESAKTVTKFGTNYGLGVLNRDGIYRIVSPISQ